MGSGNARLVGFVIPIQQNPVIKNNFFQPCSSAHRSNVSSLSNARRYSIDKTSCSLITSPEEQVMARQSTKKPSLPDDFGSGSNQFQFQNRDSIVFETEEKTKFF